MRQDRRSERVLSDAERTRLRKLRDNIAAEKDDILAQGRRHKFAHQDDQFQLVRLPDGATANIVDPGPDISSVVHVRSPRLADSTQLNDFEKTVSPEIPNADV